MAEPNHGHSPGVRVEDCINCWSDREAERKAEVTALRARVAELERAMGANLPCGSCPGKATLVPWCPRCNDIWVDRDTGERMQNAHDAEVRKAALDAGRAAVAAWDVDRDFKECTDSGCAFECGIRRAFPDGRTCSCCRSLATTEATDGR
jgi:hypothetical protein